MPAHGAGGMVPMSLRERVLLGVSLSEPHIDEFAVKFIYMCVYLCRTSCHKSLPALILRVLASCVDSKMTQVVGLKTQRTVTRMDEQHDRGKRMLDLCFLC